MRHTILILTALILNACAGAAEPDPVAITPAPPANWWCFQAYDGTSNEPFGECWRSEADCHTGASGIASSGRCTARSTAWTGSGKSFPSRAVCDAVTKRACSEQSS